MTEIRAGEVRESDRNSTLRRPTKEFKFAWDYYMVYTSHVVLGLIVYTLLIMPLLDRLLPSPKSDGISYCEGFET